MVFLMVTKWQQIPCFYPVNLNNWKTLEISVQFEKHLKNSPVMSKKLKPCFLGRKTSGSALSHVTITADFVKLSPYGPCAGSLACTA